MTNEEKEKPLPGSPQLTRRRKIANKVSEKLSTTWKTVGGVTRTGRKHKQQEPSVEANDRPEILDADFLGSLEGSDRLKELVLEPGNSYNAAVISKAKTLGQSVFAGLDSEERKRRINEQIDVIQAFINEATTTRRNATVKSGDAFDNIDCRLQALALLMLHYCSGLTDCFEREEAGLYSSDDHPSPTSVVDENLLSDKAGADPETATVLPASP
ncbi:PDZ domain containing 8 [Aphelenchoides avenae]|nr:PDZ domain containing 8 [Aphelenchus avenae]